MPLLPHIWARQEALQEAGRPKEAGWATASPPTTAATAPEGQAWGQQLPPQTVRSRPRLGPAAPAGSHPEGDPPGADYEHHAGGGADPGGLGRDYQGL